MFSKVPSQQLSFPSGQIAALPACSLCTWSPLVDALLSAGQQWKIVLQAGSAADKIKSSEGKPENIVAIQGSDRLAQVSKFLDDTQEHGHPTQTSGVFQEVHLEGHGSVQRDFRPS